MRRASDHPEATPGKAGAAPHHISASAGTARRRGGGGEGHHHHHQEDQEVTKLVATFFNNTLTCDTFRRRTITAAPVTCVDECEPCPACASCPSPPTTPSPSSSPCPSGPFAGSDTATYASSAVNAVFMAVVGVLLSFIKKYRDRAVRLQGDNDTLRQQQSSPTVSRAAAMPSPIFVPYSSSTHVNIAGEDMELTQQIPDPLG